MRSFRQAAFALILPLLVGCNDQSAPDTSRERGAQLFAENCASCHGIGAAGDGPIADSLDTPPADLTKIAARRGGVWPILEVMSIIDGYTRQTTPREDMPILSEVTEGPVVGFDTGNGQTTYVPARLLALAMYLEGLQSPPPDRYVP